MAPAPVNSRGADGKVETRAEAVGDHDRRLAWEAERNWMHGRWPAWEAAKSNQILDPRMCPEAVRA